jgi:hypothetical protein
MGAIHTTEEKLNQWEGKSACNIERLIETLCRHSTGSSRLVERQSRCVNITFQFYRVLTHLIETASENVAGYAKEKAGDMAGEKFQSND